MKIKVYAPNGTELAIRSKKLSECPLCHELTKIKNIRQDEEGVDCICTNCLLVFTSFPLRNFIKIKRFEKEWNYK